MRLLLAVLCVSGMASAQTVSEGADFSNVQLERAGLIKGNYKSGRLIEQMSEGVEMTFLGKTEAENIHLVADTVTFDYSSAEAKEPSRIQMRGAVRINLEGNQVDAGRAVFDLDKSEATFHENPVIEMQDEVKLAASIIILDLDTGDFEIRNGQRVHE